MKTCPVCNAVAFDDQATCYGCLHSYEKDAAPTEPTKTPEPVSGLSDTASFLLSFVPHPQDSGAFSWTCTVEPVSVAKQRFGDDFVMSVEKG
jgi:hypothetical protein